MSNTSDLMSAWFSNDYGAPGIMVSELGYQTIVSGFDSHRLPSTHDLMQKYFSKRL